MKIAISGAGGRMGQALIEAVGADKQLSLVVVTDVTGVGKEIGGLKSPTTRQRSPAPTC